MSDHSSPRSPSPSFSPPPPDHDFSEPSAPVPSAPAPASPAAASPQAEVAEEEEEEEEEDVPMAEPPAAAPASDDDEEEEEEEGDGEDDEAERREQEKLRQQVFGGDSDSELSSNDEDDNEAAPKQAKAPKPTAAASPSRSPSRSRSRSRSASHSRSPSAQPEEDADEAGGNYSDGDDADAKEKKLKFKKSSSKKSSGEKKERKKKDDGEGGEKPRKKKRKTAPAEEEENENDQEDRPEEPMDDATLRRMQLNRRIDEIVKAPKNKRKKSKRDGEDVLDEMNDDLIQDLKVKMISAAEKDEASVMDKRPASAKLSMLKEVMSILQQSTMGQSIVDNDLLSAVKRWLEPLPDKSLPALDIQNSFFDILVKMPIDTDTLKASGLGKVILFYSKSLRSTSHVKRQAAHLLAVWSRPIIKRSSSFRTKAVPSIDIRPGQFNDAERSQSAGGGGGGGKKAWERPEGEKIDKKRRNVRIPAPSNTTYTHAPRYDQMGSQGGGGGGGETSQAQAKRQKEQERLKRMKKQLADARTQERL
ncbi:hypothetical protein BDY24DRAFT_387693 [Mrakia frigida]|uniref:uncharacterized protein n=1 Tax=Mrakia frigida TaxID=29902 RepID=UPI003FCC1722